MEEYNPNAVWQSKKKKFDYVPPEPSRVPGQNSSAPVGEKDGGPRFTVPHRSMPGKKAAIIAAVIVVILAAAIGAWYFMNRPAVAPIVAFSSAVPSQSIVAGDPFTLSLLYTNSSTVALRNASLVVALPDGIFFKGQPQSERSETVPLGDVTAGDSGEKSVTLLATSNVGSVVGVSSTISYATDASRGVVFGVSNRASVAVGSSAIGLSVSAPANVFSGQDFETEISYRNTTNQEVDGVQITMQYPQGFIFTSAVPTPAFPGNTVWNIGTLAARASGKILITGNISGKNTAQYSISSSAALTVSGISYAAASQAANIAITASPLTISAALNNNPNYVAKPGDFLDYTITYANLSSTTFRNATIEATLMGAMFNPSSVQSAASFNSRTGMSRGIRQIRPRLRQSRRAVRGK